jgi:hypothetical protein
MLLLAYPGKIPKTGKKDEQEQFHENRKIGHYHFDTSLFISH